MKKEINTLREIEKQAKSNGDIFILSNIFAFVWITLSLIVGNIFSLAFSFMVLIMARDFLVNKRYWDTRYQMYKNFEVNKGDENETK